MRTIPTSNPHATITAIDEPDPSAGGACHVYEVRVEGVIVCHVRFQHGPIRESGVNGCQHVDLLAIVLDRIDHFQCGPFSSAINEVTGGAVVAAIASENTRTRRRELAGVEGTNRPARGVETG